MTANIVLATLLLASGGHHAPASVNGPTKRALDSIRAEDARRHIDFLASDSLMGRDTPSRGLEIAADYISKEFQRLGIQPLDGSHLQEFGLNRVRLGDGNFVRIKSEVGKEISLKIKREFMPFGFTANKEVRGGLVFAGYGIRAPEYEYDDYSDVDVAGKLVLILKHEPGEKDTASIFLGDKNSEYSQLRNKVETAIELGAAGLIVVNDPLNHRSMRPRGFPWPSLYKNLPNDAIPLTLAFSEDDKIPVVQVGKLFLEQVFGRVDSLKAIQQKIDADVKPHSFAIPNWTVSVKTTTDATVTPTHNVVGILEGSDPELKEQAVVVGAHYDHVGYKPGDAKPGEDYIFNGADDNASGTVGLLEVAEAFALGARPKRSVIFIAFSGEEKGLFGSRFYVAKPLWPLKATKAMFNMDMIGRNEGDRVSIIGFSRSPDLNEINIQENKFVGLDLEYNAEGFFARSDQYNFARKGIPILFYHTGTHDDYHQVTDNPEKINEGKIAMISKLVFRTAWRAANTSRTFQYIEPN